MPNDNAPYFIHHLAVVEEGALIGPATRIWHFAHVRAHARIGAECIVGKGVYIDAGVTIGNRVKIQNHVSLFRGVTLADGVFVGPHVCFTNDKVPRAITADLKLKTEEDWHPLATSVEVGASIGANATILPGITIGTWSLIGAGAVVVHSVPPHALVLGNPGRVCGIVSCSGEILGREYRAGRYRSANDGQEVYIKEEWERFAG